ncbi:MAG: RlmE family RNA methyltransferase [Candidatus Comchoanobacterales bacterium]
MTQKKKTKSWLKRHRSDAYVKKAQKSGLRARSAFKLTEINTRFNCIQEGSSVLELGAAPGGWTQCLASWVGKSGMVVAVDLLPMSSIPNVFVIQGDVNNQDVIQFIKEKIVENGRQHVDAVISDMAPNLSGDHARDQAACEVLWYMVLDHCKLFLKRGGSMIIKLFHGEAFDSFIRSVRLVFRCANIVKPDASRSGSREVYLVATDFKGDVK